MGRTAAPCRAGRANTYIPLLAATLGKLTCTMHRSLSRWETLVRSSAPCRAVSVMAEGWCRSDDGVDLILLWTQRTRVLARSLGATV